MDEDKEREMLDEKTLKGGGFMKQRQPDFFAVRVKILVGDATTEQLRTISEIADRFGDGTVHLTVRQCIEVPFVRMEHFDEVKAILAGVGLDPGACGARVRVPVCCPGATICKRGLNDTKSLAKAIDAKIYGRPDLPHKFKIGVTGCSASCAKPQENDVGFMGAVRPVFDERDGHCITCGVCARVCPTGALTYDDDGRPVIDYDRCEFDGKCVQSCPTRAIRAEGTGWRVFAGGKFGREPMLGVQLLPYVSGERAVGIAEAALAVYQREGAKGERVRNTLDRLGLERFRDLVLAEEAARTVASALAADTGDAAPPDAVPGAPAASNVIPAADTTDPSTEGDAA